MRSCWWMSAVARGAGTARCERLPWPVSLFGKRAVSSPRPTFETATRAASVKGGAEQPAATRSALSRAWRGLRAPDLDRREHDATLVVGRDLDADQDWVVRRFGLTGGGAATVLSVIAVGGYAAPESNRSSRARPILVQSTRDVTGYNGNTTGPPAMPQWRGRLAAPELGDSSPNWLWHL